MSLSWAIALQPESSSVPARCLPTCQDRNPVQRPKPVPLTPNAEVGRSDQATVTLCLPVPAPALAGPDASTSCGRVVPILQANPACSLPLPEPRASLVEVVGTWKIRGGVGKARA